MNKKSLPLYFLVVIVALILEYLVIEIASLLPYIGEQQKNGTLSIEWLKEEAYNIFMNPIATITNLISENNPLFFIGTAAVAIYAVVVIFKSKKKTGWEAETENTTHGGARYARASEIYQPSELNGFSKQQLLSQFKASLKEEKKEI